MATMSYYALSPLSFIVTVLITAAVSLTPIIGTPSRYLSTLVHEVGHGFTALVTGGGLSRIRLHRDLSGETQSQLQGWTLIRFLHLMAGYSAPYFIGALLVASVIIQDRFLGMAVVLFFSVFTVISLRNFFGYLVGLPLLLVVIYFYSSNSHNPMVFTLIIGTMLFINGIRDIWEVRQLITEREGYSDFHMMSEEVLWGISPSKSYIVFLAITIASTVALIIGFVRIVIL